MLLELLEAAIGNILSRLLIPLRTPIIMSEVEIESLERLGQGVQDFDTSFDNLYSDSISRDGSNSVGFLGFKEIGRHGDEDWRGSGCEE